MIVGGRLEVPGYPREQMGLILQSPEPAGSAGTMVYRGVPEEVGATLYGSGARGKVECPGNRSVGFKKSGSL
jgi:hypothetical protein